jgi:hypothetical protein
MRLSPRHPRLHQAFQSESDDRREDALYALRLNAHRCPHSMAVVLHVADAARCSGHLCHVAPASCGRCSHDDEIHWSRMLQEHARIRAATEKLRTVARAEKASVYKQFAEDLALHARTEEEVLYPAAILVGDVIRARMTQK